MSRIKRRQMLDDEADLAQEGKKPVRVQLQGMVMAKLFLMGKAKNCSKTAPVEFGSPSFDI